MQLEDNELRMGACVASLTPPAPLTIQNLHLVEPTVALL